MCVFVRANGGVFLSIDGSIAGAERGILAFFADLGALPVSLFNQKILTVGDGNLSFSAALATAIGGANITATTYEPERQILKTHPETITNVQARRLVCL